MLIIYMVMLRVKIYSYDGIKFDENNKLEGILNTTDDISTGYFIEVELKYPDSFKEKIKNFHLLQKI